MEIKEDKKDLIAERTRHALREIADDYAFETALGDARNNFRMRLEALKMSGEIKDYSISEDWQQRTPQPLIVIRVYPILKVQEINVDLLIDLARNQK